MYLQANNVEKFYGNKEARVQVLKGISCSIEQGEICVLLGRITDWRQGPGRDAG